MCISQFKWGTSDINTTRWGPRADIRDWSSRSFEHHENYSGRKVTPRNNNRTGSLQNSLILNGWIELRQTSWHQHIRFCKTNQDDGTDQKKPEVGLTVNSGVQISRWPVCRMNAAKDLSGPMLIAQTNFPQCSARDSWNEVKIPLKWIVSPNQGKCQWLQNVTK